MKIKTLVLVVLIDEVNGLKYGTKLYISAIQHFCHSKSTFLIVLELETVTFLKTRNVWINGVVVAKPRSQDMKTTIEVDFTGETMAMDSMDLVTLDQYRGDEFIAIGARLPYAVVLVCRSKTRHHENRGSIASW